MKSVGVQGLLAATACIAIAIVTPATATPEQSREYHLPAQDLGAALRALGQASGGEIIFPADAVAGKRSPALDGSFTLKEAVEVLLRGSGLVATEKNGSILIRGRSAPPEGAAEETADAAIVVTGTRIRGAPVASTVIAVTRKEMADSGQTTLGAVIRDLPQNFNGGLNPGVGFGVPESSGINVGSGTALNLRGLGSDATLTLLDGHRLAYNLNNNAVDVSTIPFEAVDRLEVVPDGSSALYGSDAVAGVVNIVLKDRFAGLRASARLGSSTEGGAFQQQYSVIAGTDWKSGAVYAAYEFGRDTPVTAEDRSFLQGRQPGLTLLPAIKHHSAMIKGEQDLGSGFEFEVEALYDKRWSERSAALNPAGDYRISGQIFKYETESFVVAPSLKFDAGADWRIVLTGMYGLNRQFYNGQQFANSAPIFPTAGCYCNKANSIEAVADGPLARLPAGAIKLAIGGGYRKNILHAYRTVGTAQDIQVSQTAYYAFGELGVPVISEEQRSFLRSLTLSAAMRYESYPGIDQVATPMLATASLPAYAQAPDTQTETVLSAASEDAQRRLQQTFTNLRFENFAPSPITGPIYQAMAGGRLLYYAPQSEQLIFAAVYDRGGVNLTALAEEAATRTRLAKIDTSQALGIGPQGAPTVIEFTDPECPYCHALDRFWSAKAAEGKPVRRLILFVTGIHAGAAAKAEHILCSADKEAAFKAIYEGAAPSKLLSCPEGRAAIEAHNKAVSEAQIGGTPTLVAGGQVISGFRQAELEAFLAASAHKGAAKALTSAPR